MDWVGVELGDPGIHFGENSLISIPVSDRKPRQLSAAYVSLWNPCFWPKTTILFHFNFGADGHLESLFLIGNRGCLSWLGPGSATLTQGTPPPVPVSDRKPRPGLSLGTWFRDWLGHGSATGLMKWDTVPRLDLWSGTRSSDSAFALGLRSATGLNCLWSGTQRRDWAHIVGHNSATGLCTWDEVVRLHPKPYSAQVFR